MNVDDPSALRVVVACRAALLGDLLAVALQEAGMSVRVSEPSFAAARAAGRAIGARVMVTDLMRGEDEAPWAADVLRGGTRLIAVFDDASTPEIMDALLAGSAGYVLLRDSTAADVVATVAATARDEVSLHPAVAHAVLQQWRRLHSGGEAPMRSPLTRRELEVLTAMAEGDTAAAIARRLGLSTKTVESHKTRLFAKLGARNQAHAVELASARGLLGARASATPDDADRQQVT